MAIQTQNPELDAVFANLQNQLTGLSEACALQAGRMAILSVENMNLKAQIEALKAETSNEL